MTGPAIFEPRTYRDFGNSGRFKTFRVTVETSDLYVKAHRLLRTETEEAVLMLRAQVEDAIARRPDFLRSMRPLEEDSADAPIVTRMINAAKKAGTGPMAAVAGAVAQFVGQALLESSPEVIVENGGDIFLKVDEPVVVGIHADRSPFSGRLGIRIEPTHFARGICTSAATVGPSLSLGSADAATVVSHDVALADALATALGNRIRTSSDLKAAVQWAAEVPGVDGVLAVLGDKIAALGKLELVPLREQATTMNEVTQ
jgi:uncharacterized protein